MPKASGLVTPHELEICARVKKFRQQIRWPQMAFASEIGLTRDQLASIEYGRTPLKYLSALIMATLFDVSSRWLATGEGPIVKTATTIGEFPLADQGQGERLFSEVWDECVRPGAFEDGRKADAKALEKSPKLEPPLDFDVTGYLIRALLAILEDAKLLTPEEKSDFAADFKLIVGNLAFDYRKRRVRQRVRFRGESKEARVVSDAVVSAAERVFALRVAIEEASLDSKKAAKSLKLVDQIEVVMGELEQIFKPEPSRATKP